MIQFLKELIERLRKEKPEFFKILQKISFVMFAICLVVAYLPEFFTYLELEVVINHRLVIVCEKLYQAFIIIFGFSFLPNKDMVKTDPPPTPIKP